MKYILLSFPVGLQRDILRTVGLRGGLLVQPQLQRAWQVQERVLSLRQGLLGHGVWTLPRLRDAPGISSGALTHQVEDLHVRFTVTDSLSR